MKQDARQERATYKVVEAARVAGVGGAAIRRGIAEGSIPHIKFGRNILISGTYINARVLRLEPALTISRAQLDHFLNALEDSLKAVVKARGL